tara:strand:- start:3565 stop:3690 length:126 start_codon:yes stop_codon:yes gene_type:complete
MVVVVVVMVAVAICGRWGSCFGLDAVSSETCMVNNEVRTDA